VSELLDGRVIAITGAASGIGRATRERALAEGARVAALDLSVDALDAAEGLLPIRCDVADPAQVSAAFDAIGEAFGGLDGLVTAAGIGSEGGDCVETPLGLWERMLAVNLTGVFLTSRAAVPLLREAGRSSVVHVASQLGLVGTVGSPAYCASKGGVIAFSRAMALDHAAESIRVNVVCPGPVDTPMFAASTGADNLDELTRSMIPLGRIGRPPELAAVIAFLLSDESSFLTGSVVAADGGWTAR
jgi:meso-butanediol dehydrogenase/(S,S)-butanediol dehydrogenase/diacetyl reductase